jgi:Putative MetA-pathway of phenol degradation
MLSKAAVAAFSLMSAFRSAGQELSLSPTRPTIANSATIQNTGVLQVEAGYDGYPQHAPGDQQTISTNVYYAPLDRLRLDFGWSPYSHQEADGESASGVGTIQAGGKIVLWKENYGHPIPGIAIQYEAELPAASEKALQGFGQQIIFLANHHYGKNGIFDVIVNASLVQSDCQTQRGCGYGGQQSFAISYHLRDSTRLYAEVFGQNNMQSNTPPGTYIFGGFYQKIRDTFGIDGGMRFGVTNHSASVGVTLGVVFGKRLQGQQSPAH